MSTVHLGYRPTPPPAQPDPAPEPCRADLEHLPDKAGPLAIEWRPNFARASADLDYTRAVVAFVEQHVPGGSPTDAEVIGDGKARVLVTTTRIDPDGNVGKKIRRAIALPAETRLP